MTERYFRTVYVSGQAWVNTIMARERLNGLRPASAFRCVDCGYRACDYDHRDYNDPLTFEPVCRSCNKLRGPAIRKDWHPTEWAAFVAAKRRRPTLLQTLVPHSNGRRK